MPEKPRLKKKVVCIGGGTGVSTVIKALKGKTDLTAVVAMFDNGCSTGQIRREFGLPPMGDLRQCLIALAEDQELVPFLKYRFEKGFLKGHNLGNILLAAAAIKDGCEISLEKIGKILKINGKILPVTLDNSDIEVLLDNGKIVKGEEEIVNCPNLSKVGFKDIYLSPRVQANPKAVAAIKKADVIIIGPGKFYTSLMPNFLVEGMADAVRNSKAKRIFICNLMTQPGNTDGFTVEKFTEEAEIFLGGKDSIDRVIFNNKKPAAGILKQVSKIFKGSEFVGYGPDILKNKKFAGADLLDENLQEINPADILAIGVNKRTMVVHDPKKFSKILSRIIRS
ncbi:MAG: gluconeogenesis factor YvcK family protein [Candidatus Paceibacterota bacterium]|jgi:uncharacterized cofD-like protein